MAAGRTLPNSLELLVFSLTTAVILREEAHIRLSNDQRTLQAAALPPMFWFSTEMPLADTNLISFRFRAKRFSTCWVPYTSRGTSSFNLVRDVLVCGVIQANPGPRKTKPSPKYPCSEFEKGVRKNQDAILCASCNKWSHAKCLQMLHTIFQYYLNKSDIEWTCTSCALPPPLSDSFFAEDSGVESLNKTFELLNVSDSQGCSKKN